MIVKFLLTNAHSILYIPVGAVTHRGSVRASHPAAPGMNLGSTLPRFFFSILVDSTEISNPSSA